MINDIYNTGIIPKGIKLSVFVKLSLKRKAECTEYRTMCLMIHITKILIKIIMVRDEANFEREVSKG